MSDEKKHKPSKKKLTEIRREGNSLKSPLAGQAIGITICFCLCFLLGPDSMVKSKMLLEYQMEGFLQSPENALGHICECIFSFTLCFLVPCVAMGHVVEALQVGFKFEPATLSLKLDRFSPASSLAGLARGLRDSWSYFFRLAIGLAFLGAVSAIMFFQLPVLFGLFPIHQLKLGVAWAQNIVIGGCALLSLFAALEYILRSRQFLKMHGMSDQELRREMKEDEGDPLYKGFRRAQHENLMYEQFVKRLRTSKCIVVEKI